MLGTIRLSNLKATYDLWVSPFWPWGYKKKQMSSAEIDHVDLSFKALCTSSTDCVCDLTIEDIEDIVLKGDISIGDGFWFHGSTMETFKQQGINLQETAKECIRTNLQYNLMDFENNKEHVGMGYKFCWVFQSFVQKALDDNNLEFFEK